MRMFPGPAGLSVRGRVGKSFNGSVRIGFARRMFPVLAIVTALLTVDSRPAHAQGPPPRQGTSSVGSNTDSFYRALGALVSATWIGLTNVAHAIVPGDGGPEAFNGLRKGTVVVVHYAKGSDSPLRGPDTDLDLPAAIEGRVERIDRGRKEITVKFDSKTSETFQLVERAVTEVGQDPSQAQPIPDRVTIDYSNEAGQKVAHSFRKKS